MSMTTEAHDLVAAALDGDPALGTLAVTGATPDTLQVHIAPGVPANTIGGCSYAPEPPFRREILTELVQRMQRLRWRRFNLSIRMLEPLTEGDLHALHRKHMRATVPFECWPGWTDLLDATFAWLHEIAPDRAWAVDQVKEKYATLRFYWHGDLPDLGDAIIAAAEHVSGHVCEVCGAPGKLQSQNGWWKTRCSEHKYWRPV